MAPTTRTLPIKWLHRPDVASVFADQLLIQHDPDVVTLSFGQIKIPLFSGTPEEQLQQMQDVHEVEVLPVVRIAVPVAKLEAFGQVLMAAAQSIKSEAS